MSNRISTFTAEGSVLHLFVSDCADCGVVFGIPDTLESRRRADGRDFYCPNGHTLHFSNRATTEQKLKEATARELALKDQAAAAVRDAERLRVALLRDRERFANGVCPCCDRSFIAVARHIKDQHPDYDVTRIRQGDDRFECSCGGHFETLRGLRIHQGRRRSDTWDMPSTPKWMAHLTEGVKI